MKIHVGLASALEVGVCAPTDQALWFMFYDNLMALEVDAEGRRAVPRGAAQPLPSPFLTHNAGTWQGFACRALALDQPPPQGVLPSGGRYVLLELRSDAHALLGPELFARAGHGRQLAHWDAHSQFCSVCGAKNIPALPISKKCPCCGNEMFPHISVAVLVLVTRGDEILLVLSHHVQPQASRPVHVLVSGFLEPGENLEECARRETLEETGLTVTNVRYAGSQAWPHPSTLMAGFFADYAGGDIRLQQDELFHAAFYRRGALPDCLPLPYTLSRQLLDIWIAGRDRI